MHSTAYEQYGVYLRKVDDQVKLEVCGDRIDQSLTGMRVGTVNNVEGWGLLDDDTTQKVTIIGGHTWVKQYVLNGLAIGTILMALPLYLELCFYAPNGTAGLPDSIYLPSTYRSE